MNIDPAIFTRLPRSGKIGVAVLGGASILTIAYYLFAGNQMAMYIIGSGVFGVICLLYFYKKALKWHRKVKSNPLTQGLVGNAAATPQGISEPARRARLDDLRRNFDQGVEKFRAAGKNLYSVPWYVLVGEPGSGKTEAIRHCNVGFPPGLQDQLQGAGGTLNMNWWFTNQAIILDTAGRLMFEEVVPGSTNEWNEFLKLLKSNRPNCPINGMLLVIPVDTLIKDSADSIEKKAGKIAQQFDQIQRILGVRFPVFIIITKCDLLNGFREFFDDLNDPQLQHQIMGWSNPAPLDEKFNPKAVTDHMENVKKRLTDRRQQLLLDPVNTEDATGRRIDQVDALYALPDSLTKIAPRLRRYLEMVFVAGEWSPKPLFLRGIYFTSSMTEGSALDAELAEVLGVPVDSLPEGRVWRRDRAYFLRDLFIEKVFREKGLVTRADNADKQQRSRRAIVMTFGFLAVIILFAVTWFGSRSLENSIGKQRDFWVHASADLNPQFMPIVTKNNAYNEQKIKVGGSKEMSIPQLFGDNLELVQKHIEIPYIFKPMTYISGNVDTDRVNAYRLLYEATILRPLYAASRVKLNATTRENWSDDATLTLAQLMKLEYADATKKAVEGDHPQVDVDPMFRFVLTSADYPKAKNDEEKLQTAVDWIYSGDSAKQWPAKSLQPDSAESRQTVSDSINKTIEYWKAQASDKSPRMGNILKVRQALRDFRDAEDKLLELRKRQISKVDPYTSFVTEWETDYNKLVAARNTASSEWAAAAKANPSAATLRALYTAALENIAADAQKAYGALIKLTPAEIDSSKVDESAKSLASDRKNLLDAQAALRDWQNGPEAKAVLTDIATLDDAYLAQIKGIDGEQHRRFEVQAQLYELADKRLPRPGAAAATPAAPVPAAMPAAASTQTAHAAIADALSAIDADVTAADDTLAKAVFQAQEKDRLAQAGDLARYTIDTGARYRRYLLVKAAADAMPAEPEKWGDYVAAKSAGFPADNLLRPQVPLMAAEKTFLPRFSPDAVGAASDSLTAIDKLCTDPAGKVLDAAVITARASAVKSAFASYLANYKKYWQRDAFDELHFAPKSWAEFAAALGNVRARTVCGELEAYGETPAKALKRIGDSADEATVNVEVHLAQQKPFQEECSDIVGSWKSLGDNPRQARGAILAMDPSKFLDGYTVATAKSSDGYVARYWTSLSLEALKLLAVESQKDILEGLLELGKYERFPLAPPGDPKNDLTAQEVILARAALEKIKGATGAGLAAGARSVGQGGLTKDKDVDAVLERLRGINLLKEQQHYLDQVEKFFAVLPMDAKPASVNVSVIKAKMKESNAVSVPFSRMAITQGGKELRNTYLQGPDPDAVDIDYPAADLAFLFRDTPDGPVLLTETIPGPWTPFRLIKAGKVLSTEGKKWTVEYSIKDKAGKTWLVWFLMEFKADLPDLKEWPVPPTK